MAEPATVGAHGEATEAAVDWPVPVLPPLTPVPSPEPTLDAPPADGSRSAEDVSRLMRWMAATFRPPQAYSERPPSAKEAVEAARATPLSGRWGAARKASGYVCAAIVTVLVIAAWIAHSPARIATAALLVGAGWLTGIAIF